jgi:hypothetical protein
MFDAMYEKVRIAKHVMSQAVVVAYGIGVDGIREVIGNDVVAGESLESWQTFLRDLKERGLRGVRLVTSDAHAGLKAAIGAELTGASWQRCKVHFMRNVLGHVPAAQKEAFAADLKSIFAQPSRELAEQRLTAVIAQYRRGCQRGLPSSRTAPLTHSRITGSRRSTGARSRRPTRWNTSTAISAGAPGSSESFPTSSQRSELLPSDLSRRRRTGRPSAGIWMPIYSHRSRSILLVQYLSVKRNYTRPWT